MCIMLSDGFNFVSHVRTPSRGIDLWIFLKVETNFEKILRHDDWDMVLTVTSWHWCISQMNYKFVGMLMFFLMCVFQKKIIYIYMCVCFPKKTRFPYLQWKTIGVFLCSFSNISLVVSLPPSRPWKRYACNGIQISNLTPGDLGGDPLVPKWWDMVPLYI